MIEYQWNINLIKLTRLIIIESCQNSTKTREFLVKQNVKLLSMTLENSSRRSSTSPFSWTQPQLRAQSMGFIILNYRHSIMIEQFTHISLDYLSSHLELENYRQHSVEASNWTFLLSELIIDGFLNLFWQECSRVSWLFVSWASTQLSGRSKMSSFMKKVPLLP